MSDTPETDEQINGKPCTRFEVILGDSLRDALVASEFARKLERERDRYKSEVEVITRERDEAREVAENLVEYAHECLVRLESWGKGYDRYEREMETIREAIAGCQKWKEAAK